MLAVNIVWRERGEEGRGEERASEGEVVEGGRGREREREREREGDYCY